MPIIDCCQPVPLKHKDDILLSSLPLAPVELDHLSERGVYTLAAFRAYQAHWRRYCPLCQSASDRIDMAFVD
jgi:hypothetical protein